MTTVAELIEFLKQFPESTPVDILKTMYEEGTMEVVRDNMILKHSYDFSGGRLLLGEY